MKPFFLGLLLLCACTLMYEIVLTRLLSVVSWYYLAFVSVSMAMFGMTAGALFVQLRPDLFSEDQIRRRMRQSVLATAIATPLSLLNMLAIPLDLSLALQTAYSFLLFAAVIAVPFFFSGVAVCLSLTRAPFSMGRIYFTDLTGAALGCAASVTLLRLVDAPSAIFVISALLFLSSAAYAAYAGEERSRTASLRWALAMLAVAVLNSATIYGIQPIWSKGAIDRRTNILAELWNPISKVRLYKPTVGTPLMWGPSPKMPRFAVEEMVMNIDNDAATAITRYTGDPAAWRFLRYDVTSLAAQLRPGGAAAIIGVGGGRDVINAAANGFQRIVGIEVNSAIADLTWNRYEWFSGFRRIPGFELHHDEGRSFLTRSQDRFDVIQASLVDTWAATSAGAMSLSENALYTVEAWKIFFSRLRPGGIITFSRWYAESNKTETYRLFSVAVAMLLSEGVTDPARHLAVINSDQVSTLLASSAPFSPEDIARLRAISEEMAFTPMVMPDEQTAIPELRKILASKTREDMARLHQESDLDYSPTYDTSPYFFNAVHLAKMPRFLLSGARGGNLRAMVFLLAFMLAALVLVVFAIVIPARQWTRRQSGRTPAPAGAIAYFVAIGLGFMLVEIAMMQQLSIFLGHPIYSLVVVLGGLILSAGLGSLASDRLATASHWASRVPALACFVATVAYSMAVLPVTASFTAGGLPVRVLACLALEFPCGFLLGFCFPIGMRWLRALSQESNLPWMWALNGAAGTLGSFVAIVLSMETSIRTCVLTGACCYLLAALLMPSGTPGSTRSAEVA